MRVLISGASGMIGGALARTLEADGHTVTRLVRRAPRGPGELAWDPESGTIDPAAIPGSDAVVHLAGASIAGGRWTASRRSGILMSRRSGTDLIARAMARTPTPRRVLVSVSAVGYYGDRANERLDEQSGPGAGFLARVAGAWEAAARPAADAGVRVVQPRFGLVLDARQGALPPLALPFRLGLGGPVGSGHQWVSWVSLDDAVRAMAYALSRNDLEGPVNVVSPRPVIQADFSRALGRALRRPSWLPVPAWAIRMLLGAMGEELLLFSQRVLPARLEAAGFTFHHPDIEAALRAVLSSERITD